MKDLFSSISGHLSCLAQYCTWQNGLIAGAAVVLLLVVTGGWTKVVKALWGGKLSKEELIKFLSLALGLFFIIGVYWSLRSLKDPIFDQLVGIKEYQPIAKIISVLVMIPVVLGYSKLVDSFSLEKMFFVICLFYAACYGVFGYLIKAHPMIHIPGVPGSALGWIQYLTIESMGGILVAHFWAFANRTTSTELAKKGYGLVVIAAQLGMLCFAVFHKNNAERLGFQNILWLYGGVLVLIPFIIKLHTKIVPAHLLVSDKGKETDPHKKKTGMFEGLALIKKHRYLVGLAFVATIYEVINTIVDYRFKVAASEAYPIKTAMSAYMATYTRNSALLSVAFSFLGTSFIIRTLGVRLCLILYPLLMAGVVALTMGSPTLSALMVAMMVLKTLGYALNNPVKEMMYIPASKDVKSKVKSVIDGFGGKAAKGIGSVINTSMGAISANYVALGVAAAWALIAAGVGTSYNKLIKNKEIIS